MAVIPQFEPADTSSGVVQFSAPVGVSTEAVSFQRLQSSIGAFLQQEIQQREQAAMRNQSDQGALAQGQSGPGVLAQPDQGLATRYQDAFKDRAVQVHNEQVKLQAQQVSRELRRQHINDPDAFGSAWMSYTNGQADALRKQDPIQAEAIGNYLTAYGSSIYQDLADARAARERAVQSQDYLDAVNSRFAQIQDELLNNPDEQTYLSALSDLETLTQNGVASGLLDPAYAAGLRDKTRDKYTEEWVRGEFNKAWNAGDMGGAKAVIEDLERGGKFVNNDIGRALSNEFQQNFKALETGRSESVSTAMRLIDRVATAAELGGQLDEATLNRALSHVMSSGKPDQIENATAQVNGAYTVAQAKQYIDMVPVSDLKMTREKLLMSAANRDSSATRAVASAIDQRIAAIEKAVDDGDPLAAGPSVPIEVWAERLQNTDNYARDSAAYRQALENRQTVASQITGIMPSKTGVLYRNEELDDFSERLGGALERGDMDEFDRQAAVLFAPAMGSPRDEIAIASKFAGKNGEAYAALMLNRVGGNEAAKNMISLVAAGKVADVSGLRKEGLDPEDVLGDKDIRRTIDALSMGDDRARSALQRAAVEAYYGSGSRGAGKGVALQDVKRIFQTAGPTVEFSNGSRLPAFVVGDSYLADPLRKEMDAVLRNPSKVGLPPTTPDFELRNLSPRAFGDGSIGVYHSSQARFLPDPSTGRPFVIKGTEAADRQGVKPPEPDVDGWFNWGKAKVKGALETDVERVSAARSMAEARRAGASDDTAKLAAAISKAHARSPAEEIGGREFDVMLRPNISNEVNWSKVGGNKSDLFKDQSLARRVAGERLEAYRKQFGSDRRAAVAAYLEGPELVKDLQEANGEKWFDALPMTTKKMIGRVESALED